MPPDRSQLMPNGDPITFPHYPVPVTLKRGEVPFTDDVAFWGVIRQASESISFGAYSKFLEGFCDHKGNRTKPPNLPSYPQFTLPFSRLDAYELLKKATHFFLKTRCFVDQELALAGTWENLAKQATNQLEREVTADMLSAAWKTYTDPKGDDPDGAIPYFDLLRAKFADVPSSNDEKSQLCSFILEERLKRPCMVELIWSYWHEEAMLVQVLNAISLRFQNRRGPGERTFAQLEIDPLRPLNNLLWGYIQDEPHRLTITRRAYEYDHQYGLRLVGRAVGHLRPADSRSNFLAAFHRLLHLTARFYQQDDDATVRADAFPLLNALKEVNLTLGEAGSNQFGDLPWVARAEMLMQLWLLSRSEMRDFLSSRPGAVYPEPWMERLESAKSLLGLSGPSVLHMYNLANMGERLLLSIRYQPWTAIDDTAQAANWGRSFRSDVQGYIHAYHAVTGVDLSAAAVTERIDGRLPAVLMRQRRESHGYR